MARTIRHPKAEATVTAFPTKRARKIEKRSARQAARRECREATR